MLVENYSSDRCFSAGSPRTTAGPQILGLSLSLSLSVPHYVYGPIVTTINSVILHPATFFISIFNVYIVLSCHHGMARPQVAVGGTASDMEGSCEYIE